MKLSVYNTIVQFIQTSNSRNVLKEASEKYPQFSSRTIGSIYSSCVQKKIKKSHSKHNSVEKMNEYYFRFCDGTQQRKQHNVILNLAYESDFSPALMARIVLGRHLAYTEYNGESPPKQVLSHCLKNPHEISDCVLAYEVEVCSLGVGNLVCFDFCTSETSPISSQDDDADTKLDLCHLMDDVYGPLADTIKRSLGHEFEFLLKRKLQEASIEYEDEDILRSKGYDKTPDVILPIPIASEGRVINWIESKASFGDMDNHSGYLETQFWSYLNRFGSGVVIYWFGFIDELDVNRDKGIVLMSEFPSNIIRLSTDL